MPPRAAPVGREGATAGVVAAGAGAAPDIEPPSIQPPTSNAAIPQIAMDSARFMANSSIDHRLDSGERRIAATRLLRSAAPLASWSRQPQRRPEAAKRTVLQQQRAAVDL